MGGLIGSNGGAVTLSSAICDVNSTSTNTQANIGGLLGYNSGEVSFCRASGTVDAPSAGLVGGLAGSRYAAISNCFSTNTVNAGLTAGGLAGWTDSAVTNCFSRGDVTGTNHNIGGLIGYVSYSGSERIIVHCYSTGRATGSSPYGGLIGGPALAGTDSITSSCYFLSTGNYNNGYGTAKTESQMKTQSTYSGWDFLGEYANGAEEYWCWVEGNDGYPSLNGF